MKCAKSVLVTIIRQIIESVQFFLLTDVVYCWAGNVLDKSIPTSEVFSQSYGIFVHCRLCGQNIAHIVMIPNTMFISDNKELVVCILFASILLSNDRSIVEFHEIKSSENVSKANNLSISNCSIHHFDRLVNYIEGKSKWTCIKIYISAEGIAGEVFDHMKRKCHTILHSISKIHFHQSQ